MKVSVVIPVYNEEKYIKQCLDSLMEQEIMADEIIIVDNNCTDKTVTIAQQYKVKIIHEKKQGITPARNAGFDNANYEIIARIDADTKVFPDWIKKIKNNFENSSIIALTGPTYFYDLPFKNFVMNFHKVSYFKGVGAVFGQKILFGSNMAITKYAWAKVKNDICHNDKLVHEDVDLALHLKKYGIIKFDDDLKASISSRRLKDMRALINYPARFIKMIFSHKNK